MAPRHTHASMTLFAQRKGLTYMGSTRPKAGIKEKFGCANGHVFEATYDTVNKSKRNGCVYCFGSSHKYNLQESGILAQRLSELETELAEDWPGAKEKARFRCKTCRSDWQEFGLAVTNKGHRCPVCFPRKRNNWPRVPVFRLPVLISASPPG